MKKTKKGSGLIFAVILLFVILAMVVTLSSVTVLETKMSQKSKSSVGAFYNADSGVEWALNKIASSSGNISNAFPAFSGGKVSCPAGYGCDVYFLDSNGQIIPADAPLSTVQAVRSVGTQNIGGAPDTQRAIEAAVATGGYSYTYYCYSGSPWPTPFCPASVSVGTQGPCDTGFTVKKALGAWGYCYCSSGYPYPFVPPGGSCNASCGSIPAGQAYVCSQ